MNEHNTYNRLDQNKRDTIDAAVEVATVRTIAESKTVQVIATDAADVSGSVDE